MISRGPESAGIFTVSPSGFSLHKDAVDFKTLFKNKEYEKIMAQEPSIVIGHTRMKTTGAITERNAHPFEKGNIVGVHNGWVSNWATFKDKKYEDHEVDSEIIFDLLNTNKNDFRKTFKELTGAFAIVWFNKKQPDRVFLVRDGNPLHMVYVSSLSTYFWCSTEQALESVIDMVAPHNKPTIWQLKEEKVYEIDTKLNFKKTGVSFKGYASYYGGRTNKDFDGYDEEDTPDYSTGVYACQYVDAQDCPGHSTRIPKPTYQGCKDKNKPCLWKNTDTCSVHRDFFSNSDKVFTLPDKKNKEDIKKLAAKIVEDNKKKVFGDRDGVLSDKRVMAYFSLSVSDYKTMFNELEQDGCAGCKELLDVMADDGFWWHTTLRHVYCKKCLDGLEREDDLVFFGPLDYAQILGDVDEFEKRGLLTLADLSL